MIFKSFSPAGKATVGLLFAVSGYLLDPLVRSIHGRSRFLTVVLVAIGGLSLLFGITELTIAVWPWLLTMLGFLVAVTFIPELSLWLPRTLGMLY